MTHSSVSSICTGIPIENSQIKRPEPDGKFLHFTKPKGLFCTFSESSLWRVPVAGSDETSLTDTIHVGHWGFMRDGISYLDADGREEVPFPIHFRSFLTGRTTVIGWIDYEPL